MGWGFFDAYASILIAINEAAFLCMALVAIINTHYPVAGGHALGEYK
jgi:hypothetical protein